MSSKSKESSQPSNNGKIPKKATNPTASRFLAGASSLVLLQVLTRIVTFLLNQILVRLSTPQVFGTAAIQFELLLSSILFISREGVRMALLRTTDGTNEPKSNSDTVKNTGEVDEGEGEKGRDSESLSATPSASASASTRKRKGAKKVQDATPISNRTEDTVSSSKENAINAAAEKVLSSNIAAIPALFGVPLSIGLPLAYMFTASPETSAQPYFHTSIYIYTFAALLSLAAEPMYILAQQELDFNVRVRSEAAGVLGRAGVTVATLIAAKKMGKTGEKAASEGDEWGLLAFALGQLAYGALTFMVYLWTYRNRTGEWRWLPRGVEVYVKGHMRKRLFDPALFKLTISMTMQSIVKHLLTEGDKFAVSRTSQLADQGGYAVASNYGSLVARIIFQPVEEISRVYFSKTLAVCTISEAQAEVKETTDSASHEGPKDSLQKELERRSTKSISSSSDILATKSLTEDQKSALRQASESLHTLLLVQTHLLLILLTFLPPYLPILLSHFLPKGYLTTSAPAVLQAYAYYLPTMSLNGLLEAFAFSVMSPYDFRNQTRMLFGASVIFGLSVWILCDRLAFGEVGLVMANVASLGVRAAWAAWFSDRWFKRMWSREARAEANAADPKAEPVKTVKGISLVQILPPFTVILCFAISSQLVRFSQRYFNLGDDTLLLQRNLKDWDMLKAQLQHIIIGGICGVICLLECYRSQKGHVKTLISLARSKSSKSA